MSIEKVIEDIKAGKLVIVVDDEDRENEGDLVVAGIYATPDKINFMAKEGRGLICVPMTEEYLRRLDIPLLNPPDYSRDQFATAWAMSVDAARGITTGISAYDRARTIEVLCNPNSRPEDLVRPGHVFPLRAVPGGVLVRAGHTEAAVDLMKLAGLPPVAVICEIMNEDGSMARLPQLREFAKRHGLSMCSVAEIIEYRRKREKLIEKVAQAKMPTDFGEFNVAIYRSLIDGKEHMALWMGQWQEDEPVLVRVHSQCMTGDIFHSRRCDCGDQLHSAMEKVAEDGRGIIVYMSQEGRGIGLGNKIRAYHLQDQGMDTVDANVALGFPPDLREYGIGAQILKDLGVRKIRLMTNNPRKIVGLQGYDLEVVERVPLVVGIKKENRFYLETKKKKLGHLIDEQGDLGAGE